MDDDGQKSATPPSLLSFEGLLLTIFLPYTDLLRVLYTYSCVPLQFLDNEWPLWQLSAIIFVAPLIRNVVAFFVNKFGDRTCLVPLFLSSVASEVMAWQPNNRLAVLSGFFFLTISKSTQSYRGLLQQVFGSYEHQHEKALRIFNVSDVLGYSTAAFVGGLLYQVGGFTACSWFQLITCTLQTVLTWALPQSQVADRQEQVENQVHESMSQPQVAVRQEEVEKQVGECPPTLQAAGTTGAAMIAVFSGAVSIFLYACEWNTYALYFR